MRRTHASSPECRFVHAVSLHVLEDLMSNRISLGILFGIALFATAASAHATQLLLNPSFESPVITTNNCGGGPPASCQGYLVGDSIGGWTVVGHGVSAGLFAVSQL